MLWSCLKSVYSVIKFKRIGYFTSYSDMSSMKMKHRRSLKLRSIEEDVARESSPPLFLSQPAQNDFFVLPFGVLVLLLM